MRSVGREISPALLQFGKLKSGLFGRTGMRSETITMLKNTLAFLGKIRLGNMVESQDGIILKEAG